MALGTGAKAKILHLGEKLASNRVGTALHLDEIEFSREQLRAFGAQTFLTLAMVTGVTAVLFAVGEFVDLRHEIVFYFVPILIAMLRWSVVQGFIAAASAAIFANWFFYEPIQNFYFTNPKRMVGLGFFLVALVIIGYLAANLRLARRASVPIVPLREDAEPQTLARAALPEAAIAPAAAPASAVADNAETVARPATVPERVRDFLVEHPGEMYCDSCVQEHLGLKWRQQVQLITATLGVTHEFKRDLAPCFGCEEVKQATQAVGKPH